MVNHKQENETKGRLDLEWTALILEAKKIGISVHDIRAFFELKGSHPAIR